MTGPAHRGVPDPAEARPGARAPRTGETGAVETALDKGLLPADLLALLLSPRRGTGTGPAGAEPAAPERP
ncbi:hypothetical protein ABZ705_22470 [Streptomyces sp. NPDC006984]|uniref:hypothetical protein n=1 Tax=Streptomyces sp. NPDC006984 TaxID=3155463 RepID=UPI0033C59F93